MGCGRRQVLSHQSWSLGGYWLAPGLEWIRLLITLVLISIASWPVRNGTSPSSRCWLCALVPEFWILMPTRICHPHSISAWLNSNGDNFKKMTSPSHLHTQAWVKSRNAYNHTYIKFTPNPAEYNSNLDLKINNTALPMATHPKVRLKTDIQHTHSQHPSTSHYKW